MAAKLTRPNRIRRKYGPYSTPTSLTAVDGRCRVARQIREFTASLVEHVGGQPSPAQSVLIREASLKNAKVVMLADKILEGAELDLDLASRCYLAWSNSLRRDLEALGLGQPEKQLPALRGYLKAV
jgi:hypothetical protein